MSLLIGPADAAAMLSDLFDDEAAPLEDQLRTGYAFALDLLADSGYHELVRLLRDKADEFLARQR